MIDGGNIMNCILLHISVKKTLSSLLKDRNGFYQFGFGFGTNMLSRTTLISTRSLSPKFDQFFPHFLHLFAIFFQEKMPFISWISTRGLRAGDQVAFGAAQSGALLLTALDRHLAQLGWLMIRLGFHMISPWWGFSMDWFKGKFTGNHGFYHQI